jgi:hypothetical protein
MDTEWGPDVFDSDYVERVQPMKFEKYARVPKEFAKEKKSKDTRLVLDPIWAWQGYCPDKNGLTEALSDNNDYQLFESYDYNTMDKIMSGYGSARNVFAKTTGLSLKREIEAVFIDDLLNTAKPNMTPEELHVGTIEKAAETYLTKEFEGYLKDMKIKGDDHMNKVMLDMAKSVNLFDYGSKGFMVTRNHVFAEASNPIILKSDQ